MTRSNESSQSIAAAEAADWFIELQAATVARERREAFVEWLQRSPMHVDQFLRLTWLQGDLAKLPELQSVDVDELLAQAGGELPDNVVELQASAAVPAESEQPTKAEQGAARRPRFAIGRAAALVVAGVATLLAATLLIDRIGAEQYATAIGEQRSMTLEDGSHVALNVSSRLRVKLDRAAREVDLDTGEALFRVAKDPVRPFSVRTPQAVIRALGTVFNVEANGNVTVVVLLEGTVEVRSHDGAMLTLRPGERVLIDGGAVATVPVPQPADVAKVIAWTERRLVFEDAPLPQVVEEFNRYSRHRLVLQDPALQQLRITASFNADNLDAFARSLEAVGVRVVKTPEAWLVERSVSPPR